MCAPGTVEEIDKLNRRQVRVTKEQNAECQKLLRLMGIPVVIVRRSLSLSSTHHGRPTDSHIASHCFRVRLRVKPRRSVPSLLEEERSVEPLAALPRYDRLLTQPLLDTC